MRDVTIEVVTADRWADVLSLFGDNGAYSNCWCTWWLLTASAWDAASKAERRDLLGAKVRAGDEPGLLAYRNGEPVGWCAVGPREWYGRLNSPRSRVYRPIDDEATWVVNCFFIRKDKRGTGVATELLGAAVGHAAERGARILEAYPVDRSVKDVGSASLFVGTLSMFMAAGFEEVSRLNDRPLVRLRPA
jgi:GNAT superfamily N-acetyltransferase